MQCGVGRPAWLTRQFFRLVAYNVPRLEIDQILGDVLDRVPEAFELAAAAVDEQAGGLALAVGGHDVDALFEELFFQ